MDSKSIAEETISRLKASEGLKRLRRCHIVRDPYWDGENIVLMIGLKADKELVDVCDPVADEFGKVSLEQCASLNIRCFEVGVDYGKSFDDRRRLRKIFKKR
jgi:hypothetical protein